MKKAGDQPEFRPGGHVRAAMDGTAFFKQLPKGDADADKMLIRFTSMKVIRTTGSYLQVELDNTGEVGYVPCIMVENPNAQAPVQPGLPPGAPGAYQVYPPLPDAGVVAPLPSTVDPTGLPPAGVIPTVIDPDAPAVVPAPSPAPVVVPPAMPPPVPPSKVAPAPAETSTADPQPPVQPKVEVPEKPKSQSPAAKPQNE